METLSLKDVSKETKIMLLRELGYDSDGIFVFKSNGEKLKDEYIDDAIKVDNMLILPGSCLILDNNPLSIASYFEDYGEIL